jgi:hypothetical protein
MGNMEMKTDIDYELLAVANETHLKASALRRAIHALRQELGTVQLNTITAYKAAGFTNREIRDIMLIGPRT